MRSCLALIMLLLMALSGFSMSGSQNNNPDNPVNSLQSEVFKCVPEKTDERQVSKEELRNVAINFYTYLFEEEHEWKKMYRKDSEQIIKGIIPIKAESLILAYAVNYNPEGHVVIWAWKNKNPIAEHGSKMWSANEDIKEMQITDKEYPSIYVSRFFKQKEVIQSGKLLKDDESLKQWEKFSIPPDKFSERHDYEDRIVKPDWWLEKKT